MAKSTYGVTPWGKWFIGVLDSYEMGARLDRGRSYANTGKVLSVDIKDCKVTAKVKGNYKPFYKVNIAFSELVEKERVFQLIEENPALLSRISSGELPEELLVQLQKQGIFLMPQRWREMQRTCNCPDDGDPCKHMAAVYYIIAREIDNDPHTIFRLRGIDLVARFGGEAAHTLKAPFEITTDTRRIRDYSAPPSVADISLPAVPLCLGLITSLLPGNPPFSDRDFAVVLAEFYHRAMRHSPWTQQSGGADSGTEHACSRSTWSLKGEPKPGAFLSLAQETVGGKQIVHSVWDAFLLFRDFASDDGTQSYRYLFYLCKFINTLCASLAFIPAPLVEDGYVSIVWQPFESVPEIRNALDDIAKLECGLLPPVSARSVTDLLASTILNGWVKSVQGASAGADERTGGAVFRDLCAAFFYGKRVGVSSPAMRSLPLAIDRWLSALHTDFAAYKYRFTLKALSAKEEDISLEFSLSMDVLQENGIIPLKDAAKKLGSIEPLRAATALTNYLPEIQALFKRKQITLSEERLALFLDEASGVLERLGIEVALPKSLRRELKPRLVIQADTKKAGTLVNYLNMDSLLDWQWKVAIGDDVLTPAEFQKLVKAKTAVVRFRDKFVRLNPEEVAALLMQAGKAKHPAPEDFLKAYFAGDTLLSFDAEQIIGKLFSERQFPIPRALNATLRTYQERGYNWICSLLFAGFGCILADDMGLGKTVQAISALCRISEDGLLTGQCLIIAPAALLENWERELERFAPSIRVSRYHGAGRRLDDESNVFLTTYQTAVRDAAMLSERPFSLLITDEAHLMKNAATRGSKTVKLLRADYRLALSGTPVENRLEDMRSLFDFTLPGYLGTQQHFKETYRQPIEVMRDKPTADRLKKITSPFLLRRLKTDKSIIQDLPDKVTVNHYAALEKEQAALYESIVKETLKKSAETDDRSARSNLILGLLTALKQVCDHPRVYDKESPAVSAVSGKAALLVTLLEEILANREKVLIFSQYVETLACLETIIMQELGESALLYHGGMPQKKRSAVIDRFQNDNASRILLVSLRAGGLGLNLTAASRVIHYDLWFNPAVENQATDRAFRIGQTRNVFVHRFITKNSFEEKIDHMLTDKKELADLTVSSGETWLSRMSHEELRELFGA